MSVLPFSHHHRITTVMMGRLMITGELIKLVTGQRLGILVLPRGPNPYQRSHPPPPPVTAHIILWLIELKMSLCRFLYFLLYLSVLAVLIPQIVARTFLLRGIYASTAFFLVMFAQTVYLWNHGQDFVSVLLLLIEQISVLLLPLRPLLPQTSVDSCTSAAKGLRCILLS